MNAAAPKRIPLRQIGNLKIFENAAFWNYRFIRFERSYEVDPLSPPEGEAAQGVLPLTPFAVPSLCFLLFLLEFLASLIRVITSPRVHLRRTGN